MSDEEHKCPECPAGTPAWVMTFADLMSLLMCFFVLLLAFSEMDVEKFKQLAGSVKLAFGVQRELEVKVIPKGTSIVKQEFSPGRTKPTTINDVRQFTIEDYKQYLDASDALEMEEDAQESSEEEGLEGDTEGTGSAGDADSASAGSSSGKIEQDLKSLLAAKAASEEEAGAKDKAGQSDHDAFEGGPEEFQQSATLRDARQLAEALKVEIKDGLLEVEAKEKAIIIRILEKGSFPSASAELRPGFAPALMKIRQALAAVAGSVTIAGHSDNVPIGTVDYRSNWELSTARAVTVAGYLLEDGWLNPRRFAVAGFGATRPLFDNDTAYHRAKNRRVEIVIVRGNPEVTALPTLTDMGPLKQEQKPVEPEVAPAPTSPQSAAAKAEAQVAEEKQAVGTKADADEFRPQDETFDLSRSELNQARRAVIHELESLGQDGWFNPFSTRRYFKDSRWFWPFSVPEHQEKKPSKEDKP